MPPIRYVSLADLKPWPGAARTHSKKQIRQIAESIRRFGFINPIVIDEDFQILAGHGRVEAARAMSLEEVPVLRIDTMSEAEKRAYVIADNKLALNAGWDRKTLGDELERLFAEDLHFDPHITGLSNCETLGLTKDTVKKDSTQSLGSDVRNLIELGLEADEPSQHTASPTSPVMSGYTVNDMSTILQVGLMDLKYYPHSTRIHPHDQIRQLARSIHHFGFMQPILIDEKNQIVSGQAKAQAALKLRLKSVPCIRVTHLTEIEKRSYILADNKLALNASWNTKALARELKELISNDIAFNLDMTGFSTTEADELIGVHVDSTQVSGQLLNSSDRPQSNRERKAAQACRFAKTERERK